MGELHSELWFSCQTAKFLLEENAETWWWVSIQWEKDFVNTKRSSSRKQWRREAYDKNKKKRLEHELLNNYGYLVSIKSGDCFLLRNSLTIDILTTQGDNKELNKPIL